MRMVLKWLIVALLFIINAGILGHGIFDVMRDRNATGAFSIGLFTTLVMGVTVVKLMLGMDIGW